MRLTDKYSDNTISAAEVRTVKIDRDNVNYISNGALRQKAIGALNRGSRYVEAYLTPEEYNIFQRDMYNAARKMQNEEWYRSYMNFYQPTGIRITNPGPFFAGIGNPFGAVASVPSFPDDLFVQEFEECIPPRVDKEVSININLIEL